MKSRKKKPAEATITAWKTTTKKKYQKIKGKALDIPLNALPLQSETKKKKLYAYC